jgi:hypothetical protein
MDSSIRLPIKRSYPSSPLESCRQARGETVGEFAAQLLITPDYYHRLCRYERRPGPDLEEAVRAILDWGSIEQVRDHWVQQMASRGTLPKIAALAFKLHEEKKTNATCWTPEP